MRRLHRLPTRSDARCPLTWTCEVCEVRGRFLLFSSAWSYQWHLSNTHDSGDLARVVEPGLFGTTHSDQAPPAQPRVWDRWDRGGYSKPPRPRRICDASCGHDWD